MGAPELVPVRAAISKAVLESRLVEWAKEYGGGRYEHIGWSGRNLLQTLVEYGGFVPDSGGFKPVPIRSAADQVEAAVQRMERGGWFAHGKVLRCDYFNPHMAMNGRLDHLRLIGCGMSERGYYLKLDAGKLFVAGAL